MTQKPVLPPGTFIRITGDCLVIGGSAIPRETLCMIAEPFEYAFGFWWYRIAVPGLGDHWTIVLHDWEFEPVD